MLRVAYGESTLCQKNVYKWYKLFTEGREDVNDDARPGRPSTSTTDENVEKNRRITIREVAEVVGISVGTCPAIFFGNFGHEACSSEVRSKIAEF